MGRGLFVVFWLFCGVFAPASGQGLGDWPKRPIRIVVPFAPGGNSDVVARMAGQFLQEALPGSQVLVENRAGAGGIVGSESVAKAAPDGYTLLLGAIGPLTVAPATTKMPYDTRTDFAPISVISTNPLMLIVHPSVPAKSVKELIDIAKAKPGSLNFGSSGEGGLTHFSGELFKAMAGVNLIHVPYRGGSLATNALLANEVQIVFANYSDALPQIAGGTVRPLGVSTLKRTAQSPDVPTIGETVAGYECESWNGLLAPRGTPAPIVEKISAVMQIMAANPTIQQRMVEVGSIAVANSPADYAKQINEDLDRWSKLVKEAGIKVQ